MEGTSFWLTAWDSFGGNLYEYFGWILRQNSVEEVVVAWLRFLDINFLTRVFFAGEIWWIFNNIDERLTTKNSY